MREGRGEGGCERGGGVRRVRRRGIYEPGGGADGWLISCNSQTGRQLHMCMHKEWELKSKGVK